jgi:hypothetical protein
MKKYIFGAIFCICTTWTTLCLGAENKAFFRTQTSFTDDTTYIKALKAWHQKRIESLKSENGWLNLAGLFWLEEGKNTFGTDDNNQIVFPKGKAKMGSFTLNKGEVTVEIDPKAEVLVGNEPISTLKVFPAEKPMVLKSGSLRWFIIKRKEKYGIRLRDLESDELKHFTGIETYPIDTNWRIKAKFEPANTGKTINITDVLGQVTPQPSPGTLVFSINRQEFRLDALDDGDELFILLADETSGKETYGGGRFLYANKPDTEGYVDLDFNKTINPPCAFTMFATCPLPPQQNRLPIAITAGEKNYGIH